MKRLPWLLCFAALLAGPSRAEEEELVPCEKVESIGAAKMGEDRVITMRLGSLPGRRFTDKTFYYAPRDKDYADMFVHLGGIIPGQSKMVKPWCKSDDK